jgi:hypothetical protein
MKRKEFLQKGIIGMAGLYGMAHLLNACTKKTSSVSDDDAGKGGDTNMNTGGVPLLLATDIIAGPTTGGENNKGAYVSLFGIGFGKQADLGVTTKVYFGNGGTWHEVDNYRALVPARGNPYLAAQELIVQIGALGGTSNGTTLNIKVTANGMDSNTDLTFMINPGDFYFADNVAGNDSTGVKNDITHPFRYAQKASGSAFTGIWATGNLKAGDFIIMRANAGTPWSDQVGYDTRFLRFRRHTGSAPTGTSGTGYITVQRYPGPILANKPEDVYVKLPNGTSRGGFMGCGTSDANAGGGKYFVLSGIRVEGAPASASTDAAPINLQSSADYWRIINCDSSFPSTDSGGTHQKNGAIAGNGLGMKVLFCYLHDVYGDSSMENHGLYLDGSITTAKNCLIAWNHIKNVTHGSLMQFYRSDITDTFTGMEVHSNVMDGGGKYGMNFANGTESVNFYNNIVMNVKRYGLRFYTFDTPDLPANHAIYVVHNIFYNCINAYEGSYGVIVNEYNAVANVQIKHNILLVLKDRTKPASTKWFNGNATGITMDRNLYFDYNGTLKAYGGDTAGIYGDPLFTTPGSDFTIGSASPAVNAANASIPFTVARDIFAAPRPGGTANDIGPVEK